MLRRLLAVLLLTLAVLGTAPAWAEPFQLPGLSRDSDAWARTLLDRFPAGGTPQARRTAEQQAATALQKKDLAAAVTALEQRVALGNATVQHFLDLAAAQLRKTPPDPQKALFAAWQAFARANAGAPEIPPLLLIADALRALDRPAQAALALEAVVERAPDDAGYKRQLADARRAAGLQVRRVRTEAESEPPRACIEFTVAPARRAELVAQDWVKLDPPVPGAAVTREGDQICISGLPAGSTTRVTLRAGLPGEQGLALKADTTLAVGMPNRRPRLAFDSRLFVLPRGQAPAVTLTSVNLSAVSLKLLRLTERNIPALLRDNRLGEAIEPWTANWVEANAGRVLWEGSAEIPRWEPNRTIRTALPFPEALRSGGPGLYVLVATPGDGTSENAAAAVQTILRTDLAPTVWRGSDGLTVQVRGYADAAPRAGVRLDLLARNNEILAQATTDAAGVARFAAALLRGEGPLAPAVLHAFAGEDFAALDLTTAAFDLSDRGVAGLPQPGPLDAFVWLDRGIYRPGETVQVMALLRDAAGAPAEVPARVTIKRPNGQVFLQATPARQADAALHLPVTLSAGAPAGTWTVEVAGDPKAPPIGRAEFRVDAFIPDRMAVEAGPAPAVLVPGQTATLPVTARFLYGAPGAHLSGSASMRLVVDPAPFPALAGYRIGLAGEVYAPESRELELAETDAQGRTTLALPLPRAPDTTQPLKAAIDITVNDPAGRGSRAAVEIPVRPTGPLIGIRPLFAEDAVDAGTEAAFEAIAVAPDGTRLPLKAQLRLVRERPDWRLVMRGSLARYETVWRDEPLETREVEIPADAPLRIAKKLDFGRYRLELLQAGGLAATSVRFRSGWVGTDSPDVPDRVDVSADRRVVPVGQSTRIHIAPPFGGQATLLVLTDRVLALRTLTVPEGGTDVDVPVEASWGPGAYVTVHVFRGGSDDKRPARAIGLTWVGVDPAARKLDVAVTAPERVPPRARTVVPVRTAPGAWVTLAAVDEGILRLTRFASPDPAAHFLGRRRLGLDIRDDWGRLIAPAEGTAALLRQGGDEGSFVLPDIPIRTVTLFTPPVQAGRDGVAAIPLDLPDFNGQVRLMAVSWLGNRIGAASTDVIVRDPLVAEALLPRFLAPGDEARLPVLLHNLDLPGGEATARITLEGPLALAGSDRLTVALATGTQAVPATVLRATGAGRGVIHLQASGPGGFAVTHDYALTIRPARGPAAVVAATELAPGAEAMLAPALARFIPGTARASVSFGAPVRYDAAALVQALAEYPFGCLEQATSRAFPLTLLPDGPLAGPDRAGRLQQAVASVLDRQRYDGTFALWTASGEAEPWLTPYALEFLLRARAAGIAVPEAALADGLKALVATTEEDADTPDALAAQAYRLYVLAFAGQGRPGAARVLAEGIDRLPTPLAKAQLGAALARAHDTPRAEAAFAAALDAPGRRWWSADYGTALRDQAAIAVLLKESGLLPDRLAALVAGLPGPELQPRDLSTQEQAWTAAAAAALGRDGRLARIALDGRDLPPAAVVTAALTGPATARNLGDRAVWQSLSATGIPAEAPPAARNLMRVQRRFFALDGTPLNLDELRQNTVFVLLLEGRAEDGQDHRALVVQGLPAGWEIAGRFAEGDIPGMPWLGKLSATETQIAADDRFAAVIGLTAEAASFRTAVRLRAVTPGSFALPGAELSDMYRPTLFARQAEGRIKVLAPE
ncbi:Alpha-2-macroglobulin family protein [Rhodovastum atsumiense]|uniref:Alpha-2-macroglobulin family protein n=1 Tax=Rhodovastum atsumiense TaxID=504468 RepID=A0A5M6IL70_9PROT|nr:MG2 domain-containing protein [Rhodovastum atsumiense]KAA5609011.1 alpha-2-macroglobulin family protein [Rhodovastum atsumiense]CAH2599071.1 Alpha-2-macroglobulin family protein [Rhodovastum atsumiense]